jgi:uncharacterized MAPEG superfamily protein
MHSFNFGTEEIRMLWASVLLGLVQVTLAVLAIIISGGMSWAVGSRDEAGPPLGKVAGRFERAWQNYLQTFPMFAAVVLLANALGKHSPTISLGADLYFYGRVAHLAIYALGISILRTLAWAVSIAGLASILFGIWPG